MWSGAEKSHVAINELVGQALEGQVKSAAQRTADGMPTVLPSVWWKDYTLAEDGPGNLVLHRVGVGGYFNTMPDRQWTRVAFARDDILERWPAANAASTTTEVTDAVGTTQAKSVEPSTTEVPKEQNSLSGPLSRDTRALPPFRDKEARALLAGMKVGRTLTARPTEREAREIVARNFATAPRDRVREIVTDLFGEGKRGPRPKPPAAK
jgi:hypothetical protein